MTTSSKADAVYLRLKRLHQECVKLDESAQNVSSNQFQREPISRIKKTTSNGKHLQPQIPSTTRQDDLIKFTKKSQKEINLDSDLTSSESNVETKLKGSLSRRKNPPNNEIVNLKPPFSNARKKLISTIEDTNKQTNQKQPFSRANKNQFSNVDEKNKQPVQKPPFSAGKRNYASVSNDMYSSSKQKQKLPNKTVKTTSNNLNTRKNDQTKKQAISKASDQSTKNEIPNVSSTKNYISGKKVSSNESENYLIKQQYSVAKATKGVERNPKYSRHTNLHQNIKENVNDDILSYDFKGKQTEIIQNFGTNRSDKINEAYRKVPRAQTIAMLSDDSNDSSDELIKQAAAFLRKSNIKKQNIIASATPQQASSPVKKNQTSRIQPESKPFSWGNALKSINNDNDINLDKDINYSSKSKRVINYQTQINKNFNNINYSDESDELNLFFTPEKELPKIIKSNTRNIAYPGSKLKSQLLDESDSSSIGNDISMKKNNDKLLSTESETEIVSDSLNQAVDFEPKSKYVNIMKKKLDKVLNSNSAELSASSDIARPEVDKYITISKNNINQICSDSINSEASEELEYKHQQPSQQFSVIKNSNSKITSIKNYSQVNSSSLSRFAQNNNQNQNHNFSSEGDDYLSSDSKGEEILSNIENQKKDSNIIKSGYSKFNINPNQEKLTVEQIKKNLLDSSTDKSSTKSAEIDEFPDLIISNISQKKVIKDFKVFKNEVLNDIQSSDSSIPESLNFVSKNSKLINTSKQSSINLSSKNRKENNSIQKNKANRFANAKYPNFVENDADIAGSRINRTVSDEISDDNEDNIPVMKNQQQQDQLSSKNTQQIFFNALDDYNDEEFAYMKKNSNLTANQKQLAQPQIVNIIEEEEDENPIMKNLPQPEPQMAASDTMSSNKVQLNQQNASDTENYEDDEIPVMKKHPKPESLITSTTNMNFSNKSKLSQQNISNIKDDDDENDDEIPAIKKPPQPEPQNIKVALSSAKAKASLNKDQFDQQKLLNNDDDDQNSDIPIPQFNIVNNRDSSKRKLNKMNKKKADNSKPIINSNLDNDEEYNQSNSKRKKSKTSPLRVSPPIGFTYFSKVGENQKFKPLTFNDNELKEDEVISDKISRFNDEDDYIENEEKFEITGSNENHSSFQNGENEELVNDSFEEKLKMARNTLSKIKGNKQQNKKTLDLFINNSFEEEEELDNINLIKEKDEILENNNIAVDIKKQEKESQPSVTEKKQLQVNSTKDDDVDDFNENQFKSSQKQPNKQFQNDDFDENDIKYIFQEKDKLTKINTSDKEKDQSKFDKIDNENEINVKQSKFNINVSDDEGGEEEKIFRVNDINNKNERIEKNLIKLENIGTGEELEEAQFKFDNNGSDVSDDEIEKQHDLDIKEDNVLNNETFNFNKNNNGSSSQSDISKSSIPQKNIFDSKEEEEEENNESINNNDIIINPKIELEEDDNEEEAPIDPYFLDNHLSDDSEDLDENHTQKEEASKKSSSIDQNNLTMKPIVQKNDEDSDDDGIADFENIKRNFLNQDFELDNESKKENEVEEDENENIVLNSSNINIEQKVNNSNIGKDIFKNTILEEEEDEDEMNDNGINIDANDIDDEEEDQVLQRLKKFYSQNINKLNSNDDKKGSNQTKTNDNSNNKNAPLNFLQIPEIEEDEDDGITFSNKTNLANVPNSLYDIDNEEEQENDHIESENKIIKSDNLSVQSNKESANDYQNSFNDSSALDFLHQDDFLEDRLFLSKNKAAKVKNDNPLELLEEEENNDEGGGFFEIQNIPNSDPSSVKSNNLSNNIKSLIIEEDEEDETEGFEIYSKQTIDTPKDNKISNSIIHLNDENDEEDNQEKKVMIVSKNNEMKSKFTINQHQIDEDVEIGNDELQHQIINKENPQLSGTKVHFQTVEYEYEYEEENLEQIEDITIATIERSINNQPRISNEIEEERKEVENKQQIQMNGIHSKHTSNGLNSKIQTVEYEYEYEEEDIIEEKSPAKEVNSKPPSNIQIQVNVETKKENNQQKINEINPKPQKIQGQINKVEYEYEYEEEKLEQENDKLISKLPQIKEEKKENKLENVKMNEEEEDFDEDAIIKRLQNFKGVGLNDDLDENNKKYSKDSDINFLEEEEDISDDSLIKRLNHSLSLMGNDDNGNENVDGNGYDDIDGETLQKRMQDFLNLSISDDNNENDSFLEKDT